MLGRLIFRILRGWWFFITKENHALMSYRLGTCETCELRKWIVCGECGCELHAKASDPLEECPHPNGNKWKNKHPLSNQKVTHGIQSCD